MKENDIASGQDVLHTEDVDRNTIEVGDEPGVHDVPHTGDADRMF